MSERVCAVPGCGRSDRMSRGWCSMHYQRWRKWGNPEFVFPRSTEIQHGTADGYKNHGCRCPKCREAHRIYYGMSTRARSLRLGPCSVRGCDGLQYAHGLCKAHYERQRRGQSLTAPMRRKFGAAIFQAYRTRDGSAA